MTHRVTRDATPSHVYFYTNLLYNKSIVEIKDGVIDDVPQKFEETSSDRIPEVKKIKLKDWVLG